MSEGDPRDLGNALRRAADGVTPREIDADAVLAASRSSRRARRTALVGTTAAVAGIFATVGIVGGLAGLGGGTPAGIDADSSPSVADAPASAGTEAGTEQPDATDAAGGSGGIRLAPPGKVNGCGAPVAPPTDPTGADGGLPLEVAVDPDGVVAPGAEASVRVTLTNRGTAPLRGSLRLEPVTVLAEDGVTVWHTIGLRDAPVQDVELAPGGSTELEGTVVAVRCTASDEESERFPADLPPLEPGAYGVGAIVVFTAESATAPSHVISPLAILSVG